MTPFPDDFAPMYDTAWAIQTVGSKPKTKFEFFWNNKPRDDGVLTNAVFSQWFAAPFLVDGIRYPTAEHWMMAEKARLFGDYARLNEILQSNSPGKAKALGRAVEGFDGRLWQERAMSIVCNGNLHKFSQHPDMLDYLLRTGRKILVEASPMDTVWGIGLAKDDPGAANPRVWKGTNLLGFALMEVRDRMGPTP